MCSIRRGYISALGLNDSYISVTLFEAYKHREAPKILGLEKNTWHSVGALKHSLLPGSGLSWIRLD